MAKNNLSSSTPPVTTLKQLENATHYTSSLELIFQKFVTDCKSDLLKALGSGETTQSFGSESFSGSSLARIDSNLKNKLNPESLSMNDLRQQLGSLHQIGAAIDKQKTPLAQERLKLFTYARNTLLQIIRAIELMYIDSTDTDCHKTLHEGLFLLRESIKVYLEATKKYIDWIRRDSDFSIVLSNMQNSGNRKNALEKNSTDIQNLINDLSLTQQEGNGDSTQSINTQIENLYNYVDRSRQLFKRLSTNKTVSYFVESSQKISNYHHLPSSLEDIIAKSDLEVIDKFDSIFDSNDDRGLANFLQGIIDSANVIPSNSNGQFPLEKIELLFEVIMKKILSKFFHDPIWGQNLRSDIRNNSLFANGNLNNAKYQRNLARFANNHKFVVSEIINIFAGDEYPTFKQALSSHIPNLLKFQDDNKRRHPILRALIDNRNNGGHPKELSVSKKDFLDTFRLLIVGKTKNDRGVLIEFLHEMNNFPFNST